MQNGLWSVSDRLGASGESWMEDRVRKIIEIVDNIDDLQTAYNNTIVLFLREVHNGTARRAVS